jgi:hypothetical protein
MGQGKFELIPLPGIVQMGPINGSVVDDFNHDGNLDVAVTGNDYGNEVFNGRYDAMNGFVLLGDGQGNFSVQTILQSGFFVPGDAKALIKLRSSDSSYLLAASQNRGPLKVFRLRDNVRNIAVQKGENGAKVRMKNGSVHKQEFYYGNSFLSQSSQFLSIDKNAVSVTFYNSKGNTRTITF